MTDIASTLNVGRLMAFTKELIRTPSLSLEEKTISKIVEKEMKELGYDQVYRDSLNNVVGIIKGNRNGKSLLFNGHIDHAGVGTMPEPFSAKEMDGSDWGYRGPVIYGRGASDMKAGIAAMVHAGGMIKRMGFKPAGDVLVTCVAREEMARGEGIKALLDAGLKADYAVSGEASGLQVYLGHRGKSEWKVTTVGRTSHAGLPDAGVNAILLMNRFIRALEKDYPLPKHEFLGDASWTVIDINAEPGALTPIVPDRCEAIFDRRFLPEETPEVLQAGLQAIIDHLSTEDAHFKATVALSKWFPAMYTDPDNPVVKAALKARAKVLGNEGTPGSWYFGVDGTFLNQTGIPCVGFGPANEHLAHTPRDMVPMSQIAQACEVYANIIMDICGEE